MKTSGLLRKKELENELRRIVPRIVVKYRPEKVVLFGSLAQGEVKEASDIDLAIVKKTKRRFIDRIGEILSIADSQFALDAFVYTPREWNRMVKENNYFIKEEVIGRGKILYEEKKSLA